MKRFQLPALLKLRILASTLDTSYHGTNAQRLFFISLYKLLARFNGPNIQKILVGALIFELEMIEQNYGRFSSPIKSKGWVYTSGSDLYTTIFTNMNISDSNPLSDDERLIYLWKFYKFIALCFKEDWYKHIQHPEEISNGEDAKKFKNDFLKAIQYNLKRIKKRETKRISLFAHGTPRLIAIQKSIEKLYGEYEEATSVRWFANAKRKSMVMFLSLVNDTCTALYRDRGTTVQENDINYIHSCNIRLGAFLFALLNIYHEYRIFSPRRSFLFRKALRAMNIKSLDDIKCDKKITWLRALSNHLHALKENPSYYEKLEEKCKEYKMITIDDYIKKIDREIAKQEIIKKTPGTAKACVAYTTSVVAQYGIGIGIAQWARSAALIPFGHLLVGSLSGPLGVVVYGLGGTLIMTQLGRLVSDNIISNSVACVYAFVLEKIGNAIGDKVSNMATYTFSVGRNGLRALLNHQSLNAEDKEYLQEWIDTLLELPDEVVSKDEKDQIRNVLGLEKEELEMTRLTV